jgi:hypothetical protein
MSRAELDLPTFPPGQFQQRVMSDLYGFDGTLWRRVLVDATGRLVVVGGGGGGGVGITDTDDNSLAAGQTTLLAIDENYVYDTIAGVWIRLQGGIDNAVASPAPQGAFVVGKVTSPLDVYVDGDVSTLNFDTSGRLLASVTVPASTASKGTVITAGANTALGVGVTAALPALPAGTLAITVQNRTVGGASRVLVRQVGGAAGTGIELLTRGSITFDNAVAALEAQNFAGPAATVAILFEQV